LLTSFSPVASSGSGSGSGSGSSSFAFAYTFPFEQLVPCYRRLLECSDQFGAQPV
jgi:hypothetical protein